MRISRILISLFIASFLWLVVAASAAAEGPDQASITLSVTPATLALAPDESAQVLIVASNPFTTVHSIALSTLDHRGIDTKIAPSDVVTSTRGDVAWRVTVKREKADLPAEPLQFRIDYDQQEADGTQLHRVKTVALAVAARAPDPVETALKLELKSAWETIEDNNERQVFLVATNTLQVPITITDIEMVPYADVWPKNGFFSTKQTLQPHEARPFSITVKAKDQVVPGPRLLILKVAAEWKQAGKDASGSVVLSHPFQVGVYGESAILAATKIPSLLLLPGFLFLTAILLLRKLFRQKPAGELELDFTKPSFWFLGITLSLLAVLVYPFFTRMLAGWGMYVLGLPIGSRNLIQAYGFVDILLLWLGVALLGVLVWAVASTVGLGWRSWQAWREAEQRKQYTPNPIDDPRETLRKISRNGKRLSDLKYSGTVDGKASPVWQLPTRYPTAGKEWVMPTLEIIWLRQDEDAEAELDRVKDGDMQQLLDVIQRYTRDVATPDGPISYLDWKRGGAVTGVQQVGAEAISVDEAPPGEFPLRLNL
jgi:hypothetical protein